MEFDEVVNRRRSRRSLAPLEVSDSLVKDLANVASLAPSCSNKQPWRFVFVLGVHARKVPLAGDADLDAIAASTPGMTGAELANLVNEAALLAARRAEERVSQRDLTDALEKVQLGAARNVVMPDEERRRTAYHEAGHALLGMLQAGADPVRKVSIIPRGRSLGVTLSTPEQDRYGADTKYLRG